ncbi:hypothetical protein COT49_02725 [candidate division WWE3 bacterium CG08_land_8_20_14_0_20_40_13]|uniref:Uncharacterized protein n=1 Tax=candidate division WWE3 bacterium CG08_land_8_20_14_0_20_40_13 TaxID=1975084 RepID=A0A2H0XDI6_UNCKA|nr:MAG: hypothetical protein COT49_02725 [candidate division WWE3 bacterium CG08_land_8_20_14_0_20_40_13]
MAKLLSQNAPMLFCFNQNLPKNLPYFLIISQIFRLSSKPIVQGLNSVMGFSLNLGVILE